MYFTSLVAMWFALVSKIWVELIHDLSNSPCSVLLGWGNCESICWYGRCLEHRTAWNAKHSPGELPRPTVKFMWLRSKLIMICYWYFGVILMIAYNSIFWPIYLKLFEKWYLTMSINTMVLYFQFKKWGYWIRLIFIYFYTFYILYMKYILVQRMFRG